jgi:hypothetical protein
MTHQEVAMQREVDPDRQREDQYDREWQENQDERAWLRNQAAIQGKTMPDMTVGGMIERKGASYNITQKRSAQDPNAMAHGGRRPSGSNVSLSYTSAADVAGSARPVPMG